jgi:hypothetical protein
MAPTRTRPHPACGQLVQLPLFVMGHGGVEAILGLLSESCEKRMSGARKLLSLAGEGFLHITAIWRSGALASLWSQIVHNKRNIQALSRVLNAPGAERSLRC